MFLQCGVNIDSLNVTDIIEKYPLKECSFVKMQLGLHLYFPLLIFFGEIPG